MLDVLKKLLLNVHVGDKPTPCGVLRELYSTEDSQGSRSTGTCLTVSLPLHRTAIEHPAVGRDLLHERTRRAWIRQTRVFGPDAFGCISRVASSALISSYNFISFTDISNILRYLYEKPPQIIGNVVEGPFTAAFLPPHVFFRTASSV